jgi:3-deoxy-manno-octulosonate cytidylyltransferase (CMP-KDO synthetase)
LSLSGVLAVIPARYGSSRFPGKPLACIAGVPLVLRVHERVTEALPRDQVIVATDDLRVRACCEAAGANVVMTSSRCMTGTDRVWEAVRNRDERVILNVQGDEPLIEPEDILSVLASWEERGMGVVNAMCAIECEDDVRSLHVPKVSVHEDGRLAEMSRSPLPFHFSKYDDAPFRRQVCIYAFGRRELEAFGSYGRRSPTESLHDIEILRFLDLGIDVNMVEVTAASHAVDVPEDVERIEALLRESVGR